MNFYADTSLLISYYINDSHSVSAQSVLQASTGPFPFTGLHRVEMRNALALGVFRRILTPAQVSAAWSDVERDLRSGQRTTSILVANGFLLTFPLYRFTDFRHPAFND